MSIRVRFAPSPTGALHIGGIRTALYNYLLAKKHGGTFILRIEDTDQSRYVEGAEQYIIDALKWCGIEPTEGVGFGDGPYAPYRQSERSALYKKYAQQLIDNGYAYYAFDTPEELEAMRQRLQNEGAKNQSYSLATRQTMRNSLTLPEAETKALIESGKPYVIRMKMLENQTVTVDDIIRGEVSLNSNDLDDKVLMKADGLPTYHLANIVDDYEMKITHVIRGEEWLPSVGHHVMLYQMFGWTAVMPRFAHLPLILKPDGKGKLSKRDGAKFGFPVFPLEWKGATPEDSFEGFRSVGFDPRAVLNFLALLGWNPGNDQEIFTIDELANLFSLEKIQKGGARFDYDKAKWFNQQYIHNTSNEQLAEEIYPLSTAKGYTADKVFLTRFASLMKDRAVFLNDFLEKGYYFFEDIKEYDYQNVIKRWKPENRDKFGDLITFIAALDFADPLSMEHAVKDWINANGLKMGEIMPLIRIALAGTMQGPGVFDMAALLGKEETLRRLNIAYINFDKCINSDTFVPKPLNMDFNKQIIDQRIRKIVDEHPEWFEKIGDSNQKLSKAFTALAVSSYLGIDITEAVLLLTDGGNDAGIDAIYIGDIQDNEFSVYLFQSKYVFDLDKDSNFPANSVVKVISSIKSIFNPKQDITMNDLLKAQVEEIRSRISLDGYIPIIKTIFINNGLTWNEDAQNSINTIRNNQVTFEHFNHSNIISALQSSKPINTSLKFIGKSFAEDFNFKRVMIGSMSVNDVADLFERHGDNLLETNIRKYLGLHKNRVNNAIEETLMGDKKDNFYFYNNGITMICKDLAFNNFQETDRIVRVENLQIINGGQTCKTIQQTIKNNPQTDFTQASVLVRLYELKSDDKDGIVTDITFATNNQNPVDLKDLRANDEIQKLLITSIADLGYHYKPKRDTSLSNGDVIPSSVAAEAVFAIWRKKPHQAKFLQSELFGKFYEEIFKELNGAQLVIAVLIYRFCDNQRRKSDLISKFPHIPYSNYFLSMIIANLLLKHFNITLEKLTHKNFNTVKVYFDENKDYLFSEANNILLSALKDLFPNGYENIDLRRLSAAFRRGDLLDFIP